MGKKHLAGIILAAGRGKRMRLGRRNKVVLSIGNKPIILYATCLLEMLNIKTIIVVVGFAKASVMRLLVGEPVIFAEQNVQLGTAHALKAALRKLPRGVMHVLVLQGDDAFFYDRETLEKLLAAHFSSKAAISFLTLNVENPFGLGRVVRDNAGKVVSIVEEKDATQEQKRIQEINPACYVFLVSFLRKYIKHVKKSKATKEYYLTSLIDIARENREKVTDVAATQLVWRGVNTWEELKEARRLFLRAQK